jgi:hypothetical protein
VRLIWFLGLAACYQPNAATPCTLACTTSCPPGLDCIENRCVERNGTCPTDARIIDAQELDADAENMPMCVPSNLPGSESVVLNIGAWFSARLAAPTYAVVFRFEGTNNDIGAVRGTDGAITNPAYSLIALDTAVDLVRAPRLSPSGTEMFLRIEPTGGMAPYIARRKRSSGNMWSIGVAQVIASHVITDDDPSPPTTTTPRRMILSRPNVLVEIEETAAENWKVVEPQDSVFTLADNTPVAFLGQAHLTTNGLRMVFRGQVSGQLIGAFYADRTSLTVPFSSPVRQLQTSMSAHTPFFTSDCTVLFYTTTNNQVMRVAY